VILRQPFWKGSGAIACAALLLLCAAFMPKVNLPGKTYSYIVVLDITQSMNVVDYDLGGQPVSRLAFAREAVRRSLRDLPCGSRIGWGAFAEYRTVLLLAPVEVSANYNDLLASLDRIDGRMRWANASEITKGVYWAMRAARDVGGKPAVLFLTDGQEAPPEDGPGLPLFDDLKRGGTRGWLIGVGGYVPRRIPRTDDEDKPIGFWRADEVVQRDESPGAANSQSGAGGHGKSRTPSHEQLSEVREPHLRSLAREVGFEYAHLDRLESVGAAMTDPRFANRKSAPTDLGWIPALGALLLLAMRFRF
jgi:mxaL protein